MTISALALDDDNFYWAAHGSGSSNIRLTPKLGGSTVVAVENIHGCKKLQVKDGYLYWISSSSKSVSRISVTGSFPATPTTISLGYDAEDFSVGSGAIFFVDDGEKLVGKMPLAGGGLVELATSQPFPKWLTIDDTWVFYAQAYGANPVIRKVNQTGGSPKEFAVAGLGVSLGRIVVDDTHVYWAEKKEIWRAPK